MGAFKFKKLIGTDTPSHICRAAYLRQWGRIEMGGHTDNVGSAKNNQILSEARANTVRTYLLSKGIYPNRVTAKGYGLSKTIVTNKTAAGRTQNSRTEVTIL